MLAKVLEFLADESGAAALEYALIAGLVSIASLAAWGSLGGGVNAAFESVSSNVETAASDIPSDSSDIPKLTIDSATFEGATR